MMCKKSDIDAMIPTFEISEARNADPHQALDHVIISVKII